ncbi:MAG: methyltransferase domain-containing protein [Saprospiraceae bacterium]
MKPALLKYLVDPTDGTSLQHDAQANELYNPTSNQRYAIEKGVPVLLKPQAVETTQSSIHHERQSTDFHYVDHYQKDAEAFDYFEPYTDGATVHENRRLHEAILCQIPKNAEVVLDVGSGGAWLAQALEKSGKEVISFDVSTKNTIAALAKYPYENHHAVTGDVYALPFAPQSIDCIVTSEVIEHVPNPASFLQCLLKVLKPSGKLIVTTPYNEKIQHSLCIHCNCVTPLHAHLHSFTKDKIKSLLTDNQRTRAATKVFSNKALTTLRTHVLLKYLPFSVWRIVDGMVNKVIKKPARLMMVVVG